MPLTECEKPCWEARCDVCGEGDEGEFGGCFHYGSRRDAEAALQDAGWDVSEGGMVTCESCAYEREAPDAA